MVAATGPAIPLCNVRQHAQPGQNLASALRMSVTANMRPSTTPTICAVRLSFIRRYYPARLEPGGSRDHTFALLVKHSGYRPRLPDIRAQDRCERRAGAQILRGNSAQTRGQVDSCACA